MSNAVLTRWLIASGVTPTIAKTFADPLNAAMALHGISTKHNQAAFVAQCMHESGNFVNLEENLYYTTALSAQRAFGRRVVPHLDRLLRDPRAMSNFVYANRNGNGDEASGDGWRYRGRGLIGLTGKTNYATAQDGTGRAYLDTPGLVAQPSEACLTAAWYWASHDCNHLMELGDFDGTTRAINGQAMLGKAERAVLYRRVLRSVGALA